MDSLYRDPQGTDHMPQPRTKSVSNARFSTGRSVKKVPQNLNVQNQLHDDLSEKVQLGFDQFLHSFSRWYVGAVC